MQESDNSGISTPLAVITNPNPFTAEKSVVIQEQGLSVSAILSRTIQNTKIHGDLRVWINDVLIPQAFWHRVVPKSGALLIVQAVPRDATVARTAAMIGVAVLATYVAGPAGVSFFSGSQLAASVAGAATMAVGMLATHALIPLSEEKFDKDNRSETLTIQGGRNREKPFAPIPQVLGTCRYTPPLGASPFTSRSGSNYYLTQLFLIGYGPVEIYDHRIGETLLSEFSDVEIQVRNGYLDDEPITLYPGLVEQDSKAIRVFYGEYNSPGQCDDAHPDPAVPPPNEYVHTTSIACSSFDVNFTFPNGLIGIKNQGDREVRGCRLEVSYRVNGDTNWILADSVIYESKTTSTLRETISVTPSVELVEVQYDVRVRRVLYNGSRGADDCEGLDADEENTRFSASYWTDVTMYSREDAITSDLCLASVALRIRATNQLQGVVDDYNCKARSICLDYDGVPGSWTKRATNNPASIYRHILQGQANKNAIKDCRIDIPQLEKFHDWCESKGFTFNMVRDFRSTVFDTLRDIAAAGRGRPSRIDGKWGVIYDDQTLYETPVWMFTPRNSWAFSGSRQFINQPDGFKVRYNDSENDQKDFIAYDVAGGVLAETAVLFEGISFPGLDNENENRIMAEYQLANARLRQEKFSWKVDLENLRCTQGDPVLVQQDVINVGVGAARITDVAGGDITLDSTFTIPVTPGVQIRNSLDTLLYFSTISNTPGEITNVLSVDSLDAGTAVGDLVVLGVSGILVSKFVIDTIKPSADFSAILTAYDYAPGTDV